MSEPGVKKGERLAAAASNSLEVRGKQRED